MKNRFTTLDLVSILPEIKEKLVGNRVYQVYDIDNKTFLIRFSKPSQDKENIDEETFKQMLILESAIRIHLTEYDWPKSSTPSGFTMKLRKHLKNKRLESIKQIGNDRIVDMQFGTNEFANHIILELYSKGNIILTDKEYVILSLIRFYKDPKTNINIAVREKYPLNQNVYIAEQSTITRDKIMKILENSKEKNFKKIFNPHFLYGPNLLEHSLLQFKDDINANNFKVSIDDLDLLEKVFQHAESMVQEMKNKISNGYIILKTERKANSDEDVVMNDEFHPYLFKQYALNSNKNTRYTEYETFNKAVDVFFSSMESQKIESKVLQQEKQAMKKLDAIKKDHESRLENLSKLQDLDNQKARLIENNIELVDSAISVLRSAIANKYSWDMISEMVKDAQDSGDPIASKIKDLKLEKNCFSMLLDDPYEENGGDSMIVDIDIDLSAYSNARKYYEHRKDAAKKEQKTLDHTEKVFKNVEKKVKQQLKESTIKTTIVMAKKTLWFEKFLWFISSEGYLVIAGRDAQQNEMIVKRYLNKDDIYVHADMHGATSVVIKNHFMEKKEIPPKTINEAANMAVCFSASWDAKVVAAAYWVYSHQVQKTAPTGQYLSVGSFMIRGKKNYIPLQNLILGFGILFRIDDESLERRRQQQAKENSDNVDESKTKEDRDTVSFPDTTIKYKDLIEEPESSKTIDDNDYTIVNTGENIKKKIKVITQKQVAKKTVNEKRKDKKNNKNQMNGKYNPQQQKPQEKEEVLEEPIKTSEKPKEDDQTQVEDDNNQQVEEQQQQQNESDSESDAGDESNVNQNNNADAGQDDDDYDEEVQELSKSGIDHQRILSSLVANPNPEDNLLYAIPVCGPYASMQSYKYKVKIVPGTTRRGKASKTAIMIFLKEKNAFDREKDLLKAIKDQDISKNMPAKVKLITRIVNK